MALAPLGAQVRPYRDYLTPALHRRFNKASRYTLLLCYAIACWMGEWDSLLWLWFPLGYTGIRTLLLFLPALFIYVLRVAQWHVGHRHTLTRAGSFHKYFFRKDTVLTTLFYICSAWIFGQVYIWSRAEKSKLAYTDAGRAHERVKLNERPLYFQYLLIALALAQSALHLSRDYDNIDVQAMKPRADCQDAAPGAPPTRMPNPRRVLIKSFRSMLTTSASLTLVVAVAGSAVYFVGIRQLIWDYYYSFQRYFTSLSKTSRPTGIAPAAPLFAMFVVEGTLLALMWQFVNKAFDLYIAQEPLKHGVPITSDSKDPNGTLLNGLKSKKDAVKAIAFWELALITDAFPDRRKTIYGEIDRKKGPTFNQVTDICLAELRLLIERLNVGLDPAYTPVAAPGAQQPAAPVNLVPQISNPLKDDRMIVAPPANPVTKWEQFEATTSSIAKAHSSSANVQQAYGREAINMGKKKAQEGAQQADSLASLVSTKTLSSPVGWVFSRSLPRTARMVVLGAPYSRISLICNAVTALTNLTMFSISQDALGRFHQGVPDMVRVFTLAINKIDEYMSRVEIHWSDKDTLSKPEAERRKVPEVEQVRECLQDGLEKILASFADYLVGMGMSRLEIMEAKKVAKSAKKPEMVQAGAGR